MLIHDLRRAAALQPLTSGGRNRFPIWTSDSRRVAFLSTGQGDLGIFWQAADGTSDGRTIDDREPPVKSTSRSPGIRTET